MQTVRIKDLTMTENEKTNDLMLVTFGNLTCDLNFCSFRITTETKEIMDPYDLSKTVVVKFHMLDVYDAVMQMEFHVKLVNPDDPTVRRVATYLKSKGIVLNTFAGRFEYLEESAA